MLGPEGLKGNRPRVSTRRPEGRRRRRVGRKEGRQMRLEGGEGAQRKREEGGGWGRLEEGIRFGYWVNMAWEDPGGRVLWEEAASQG